MLNLLISTHGLITALPLELPQQYHLGGLGPCQASNLDCTWLTRTLCTFGVAHMGSAQRLKTSYIGATIVHDPCRQCIA